MSSSARPPVASGFRVRTASAVAVLLVPFFVETGRAEGGADPSVVGLDHVPTVVGDLERAADDFRRLGFALKPGRAHANGLRNVHVKFEDGSGIELVSPPARPADALSRHYADLLGGGEGPAFVALHARRPEDLESGLRSGGIRSAADGDGVELDEPELGFLFFVRDYRSPTDRPEHFAHGNSAVAMTGVWLALDDRRRERLATLLVALGARRSRQVVGVPDPVEADVFAVQNGRVVVLPENRARLAGRPVVGVELRVRDLAATPCGRSAEAGPPRRCLVPPSEAHGLWLAFHDASKHGEELSPAAAGAIVPAPR